MDYLKAIEKTEISVTLGGVERKVSRASLRTFFQMNQPSEDEAEFIARYLSLACKVPYEEAAAFDPIEAIDVYQAIAVLNEPSEIHLDFAKGDQNKHYDYTNRALASIVTRLASAFGWDRDYILDKTTYDEARCYLQEITLEEHNQREYLYSLSEVGYTYDQHGRGRQKQFPPPPIPPYLPTEVQQTQAPVRIPAEAAVAGVVISFDEVQRRRDAG